MEKTYALKEIKPKKALNKAFLKVKPNRTEIEGFKTHLITLLDRTNDTESEEFHKNLISDFLKDTYYKQNHFINTKGRNDLVIHNGNNASSSVGVIMEAKKPTNKAEMMTTKKLNVKAFQELVLYYLRERITHKNVEVKHLVATNINEWFIFDATLFDRLFAQNKNFVKQFTDFEGGRLADTKTDFFYKQIAEPFIADLKTDIEFTYFDLQEYQKPLRNDDKADDNKLIALFKLLSAEHLLKLPFTNDSNSLDKRFYSELLHIIGLTETKEGSKKLIERNKEGERNPGSILEDAIIQLDSLDKISRLDRPSQFGSNQQERLFNVGLELSITWINRILFLKLLEAQLITYHKGDKSYSFLKPDTIKNYDDLNSLFFQVLARQYEERNQEVKKVFEKVPYLNSSLFEPTEMEQVTLFISNLKGDGTMPVISTTVLKNDQGKKRTGNLTALAYLFEFLNAYDFTSEGSEEIQEDNKSLINASVLGLIFEKINGYKDGSFFTPGFITMYMCRETIRKAVVQKFNEYCLKHDFPEVKMNVINDIYALIPQKIPRKKANEIINSIKICDPAVGSGHFLVSALNEMIAVKNDLKILEDKEGKSLHRYEVEVVNDELIVTDEEGELFEYNPTNKESQRIQETLFHEKQTIIEKCLFGVDINPNSVKICRLRLWIELLKNAYYKNATALETLPNIDINIKCGNSLVSRFAIDADLSHALKKSKWSIDSYRIAVNTYQNAESKEQKRQIEKLIADIRSDFRSEISLNDPKLKKLRKLSGDLFTMTNQTQLFDMGKKEKADWNKKVLQLTDETKKIETEIEEIKANKIFENAFEWRFEFPEILNDDGEFVGFDVVIGNPPYISNWDLSESNRNIVIYLEEAFKPFLNGHWDLFGCFVILGSSILKENGFNSYILPTSFYKEKHSTELRRYFLNQIKIIELIDFKELVVFEDVARQTGIYLIQKTRLENNTFIVKNYIDESGSLVKQDFFKSLKNFAFKTNVNNQDIILFEKLNANSVLLGNIVCINTGVVAHSKVGSPIKFTKDDVITKQPKSGFKQYVIGSNLSSYTIIFDGTYMDYNSKIEFFHRPKFPLLFESNKIIIRRISGKNNSIIACFDDSKYYSNDNLMHLVKWNQEIMEFQKPEKKWDAIIDSNISLKLITAILNSKLCTYFFSKFLSTDTLQGSYSSIYPEDLRQIPIKEDENLVPVIENYVGKVIEARKQNPTADTTDLENQIDQLVYQLYELTDEEIKIIEAS